MQIADVVAERIESMIVEGVLKPGQVRPSERRLSIKLDVSRSAVREGLNVLRARGIVDTTHGRGSFVAAFAKPSFSSPMMHLLGSQPRTLYDIFEVREMLEAESARLAALRGTQADFARITRRYEDMLALKDTDVDASIYAQHDYAFHQAICEASHNPVLVHTLCALTDLLLNSVFASVNNLYHRKVERSLIDQQHARLYQAVISQQSEQAPKIASAHIDSTTARLWEIEAEVQQLVRTTLSLKARCRIPDDCIDKNRYPLFMAREVLRELVQSVQSTGSLSYK